MAVHCSECGEEVLGAANRCWRCGREFRRSADGEGKPPVRRAPVELTGVGVQLVGESGKPDIQVSPSADTESKDSSPGTIPEPPVNEPPATNQRQREELGKQTRRLIGLVSGMVALLVAMLAVATVVYHWWVQSPLLLLSAFMVSLVGIGLGIGTLNSRGRAFAMIALILSITGLAVAGFLLLLEVYELVLGVHPFLEPPIELVPDEMSDGLR